MRGNISNRIQSITSSPIRKLSPFANEAKAKGVHVYHLNIGQPDIKTPQTALDAVKNLDISVIAYGPSEGLPEYRNALPAYYAKHGLELTPDDIMVTTAGSEAVQFAMLTLCDPGDEIIIPEPFYTNFGTIARVLGLTVVPVTSRIEDDFQLPDPEEFERKITDKTKAILFNSPCNPTGTVYSKSMIEALIDIANRHNLFLIADEVYREFIYDSSSDESAYVSILSYPSVKDRAVVLDSVSKRFSMCGARIGAVLCRNHNILRNMLKIAQARLCPPAIEQLAAYAALKTPDSYMRNVLDEYRRRRDTLVSHLEKIPGLTCSHPAGAFYLIAKLPVSDAEDFATFMLRDFQLNGETVMVAPAAGFYATPGLGEDEVRIAYVLKEEDLIRSVEIIREALAVYNG